MMLGKKRNEVMDFLRRIAVTYEELYKQHHFIELLFYPSNRINYFDQTLYRAIDIISEQLIKIEILLRDRPEVVEVWKDEIEEDLIKLKRTSSWR